MNRTVVIVMLGLGAVASGTTTRISSLHEVEHRHLSADQQLPSVWDGRGTSNTGFASFVPEPDSLTLSAVGGLLLAIAYLRKRSKRTGD